LSQGDGGQEFAHGGTEGGGLHGFEQGVCGADWFVATSWALVFAALLTEKTVKDNNTQTMAPRAKMTD
jgi:hypothetical protein